MKKGKTLMEVFGHIAPKLKKGEDYKVQSRVEGCVSHPPYPKAHYLHRL